jgi:hypothetical protein
MIYQINTQSLTLLSQTVDKSSEVQELKKEKSLSLNKRPISEILNEIKNQKFKKIKEKTENIMLNKPNNDSKEQITGKGKQ